MKTFVLYHHLGLGDHFICNGLVNKLSETCYINLICKKHNFNTVSCLYQDNKNVKVIPIDNEPTDIINYYNKNDFQLFQVGFKDFNNKTFDKSFYSQFGYDFNLRYDNFKVPKNIKNSKSVYEKLSKGEKYCLISNICSEGEFDLNIQSDFPLIFIKPGITPNLLDYIDLIFAAEEIHCVDSSVYHLVDSLNVKAKLYFHDVRNSAENKIRVSEKWKII